MSHKQFVASDRGSITLSYVSIFLWASPPRSSFISLFLFICHLSKSVFSLWFLSSNFAFPSECALSSCKHRETQIMYQKKKRLRQNLTPMEYINPWQIKPSLTVVALFIKDILSLGKLMNEIRWGRHRTRTAFLNLTKSDLKLIYLSWMYLQGRKMTQFAICSYYENTQYSIPYIQWRWNLKTPNTTQFQNSKLVFFAGSTLIVLKPDANQVLTVCGNGAYSMVVCVDILYMMTWKLHIQYVCLNN